MKTSEKKIEEEKLKDSSKETLDPFAGDFFGVQDVYDATENGKTPVSQTSKVTEKFRIEEVNGLDWNKDLPKVSYQEANFSNQFSELPKKLSEQAKESIQKTFSRYTQLDEKLIDCKLQSVSEVSLLSAINTLNQTQQVFLTIQSNPKVESSIIAINAEFASALIDLVLGGKGYKTEGLRPLSAVEQTILEFLAINVLGQLNQMLGDSTFSLQSVENELNKTFSQNERSAEVILKFAFGDLEGNATILLPSNLLSSLGRKQGSLFVNETPIQKFTKYGKISNDLATNIFMGTTRVNANDLLFLEKEDVILLENPRTDLREKITVFVGDSTNVQLNGKMQGVENSGRTEVLTEKVIFEIQEVFSEEDKQSQPRREKMDKKTKQENENVIDEKVEKNNFETQEIETEKAGLVDDELETDATKVDEEIDEAALSSLENVMINLRVNLGGRRLSLKELQKIRIGQIIELGCRPNDPVEVVTDSDNRPIASGELIEIEGQIGVRLTKVFV